MPINDHKTIVSLTVENSKNKEIDTSFNTNFRETTEFSMLKSKHRSNSKAALRFDIFQQQNIRI